MYPTICAFMRYGRLGGFANQLLAIFRTSLSTKSGTWWAVVSGIILLIMGRSAWDQLTELPQHIMTGAISTNALWQVGVGVTMVIGVLMAGRRAHAWRMNLPGSVHHRETLAALSGTGACLAVVAGIAMGMVTLTYPGGLELQPVAVATYAWMLLLPFVWIISYLVMSCTHQRCAATVLVIGVSLCCLLWVIVQNSPESGLTIGGGLALLGLLNSMGAN